MKKLSATLIISLLIVIALGAFLYSKYIQYNNLIIPSPVLSATPEQPSRPNQITICQDCQGQYGDLRIGLGFVRTDTYTLAAGKSETGLVAGLWLFYRNDSSKNKVVTAHTGQQVKIGRYTFTVVNIEGSGRGGDGSVTLDFKSGM